MINRLQQSHALVILIADNLTQVRTCYLFTRFTSQQARDLTIFAFSNDAGLLIIPLMTCELILSTWTESGASGRFFEMLTLLSFPLMEDTATPLR